MLIDLLESSKANGLCPMGKSATMIKKPPSMTINSVDPDQTARILIWAQFVCIFTNIISAVA